MTENKDNQRLKKISFWVLVWGLGLAGQLCWNMENQWFNTFVYAKIVKDPTIISWMVAISAIATTLSTFLFGTYSDRKGTRKKMVAIGYILWGIFTILFGCTQYLMKLGEKSTMIVIAGIAVVLADMIMSFFGSMGNDSGFNAWTSDNMNDTNRGQIGAALATQPAIGTIVGTVLGGMLVGATDNYMRLFVVMGAIVIVFGVVSIFAMKDAPNLKPTIEGPYWKQFASVFSFKKFFSNKELVWVNIIFTVFFIGFNVYFIHIGNYMIYYLGFTADKMGYIEGIALLVAMFLTIPAIKLINKNKTPYIVFTAILLSIIGLIVLFFVRPENVNTATLFNWNVIIGIFLVGAGYIVILQALLVWSKQLYPDGSKGQFEGIRILFFVMIPMIVGPLIANPIIKMNIQYVDADGFPAYLPTETLFIAGAVIEVLAFIPAIFAKKLYDNRIKALSFDNEIVQ